MSRAQCKQVNQMVNKVYHIITNLPNYGCVINFAIVHQFVVDGENLYLSIVVTFDVLNT